MLNDILKYNREDMMLNVFTGVLPSLNGRARPDDRSDGEVKWRAI